MTRQEIQEQKNAAEREILAAEAYLSGTDYIAAKLAEGVAEKSEYAEKLARRQAYRDEINAAKEEIKRLDAIEPEDESEQSEGLED